MTNPGKKPTRVTRVGITLVLPVFLLTGPPAPLSFAERVAQGTTSSQEPQGPPTATQEPQEKPAPPARVARVLLHGPICVVAATMGFIVLAGSFGTTWGSYKALLDEQCIKPFKDSQPPSKGASGVTGVSS